MSLGGVHYNETSTFASKESTDEYVDTAIARNIQHSLRCYQYEGHFRHLRDLYEKNELTSAINRVVEDINHRFTLEVLTQDWKSHDLGISASNLRRDREEATDILDRIDLCGCHRQSAEAAGDPQQGGTNRKTGRCSCGGDQGVSGFAGPDAGDRGAAPAGCRHKVQPHSDCTAGSALCAGGRTDPQSAAG